MFRRFPPERLLFEPLEVIGHSAGGPGSVGAVYNARCDGKARTVAVFTAGSDEGVAEEEALRMLIE